MTYYTIIIECDQNGTTNQDSVKETIKQEITNGSYLESIQSYGSTVYITFGK